MTTGRIERPWRCEDIPLAEGRATSILNFSVA
jgi:hypothetical protein